MPTNERGQVFLSFDARLYLNHVRIAKTVPTRKVKKHAITIPAMAPDFNDDDDVEESFVFCDKEFPEDVGGDKVDENEDTAEGSDIEEVGVDVWDGRELV